MAIYNIGVFKSGKNITGFRLLEIDGSGTNIQDVAYNAVYSAIYAGKIKVNNLKVESGKVVGINGSLSRYGEVDKSQAIIILKAAINKDGKVLGYICSDSRGNVRTLSEYEVIDFAERIGLANGKIVSIAGKKRISAIEGGYETFVDTGLFNKSYTKPVPVAETKPAPVAETKPAPNNNESNTSNNLYLQAITYIDSVKTHPRFKGSIADRIETTIRKTKTCSERQFECIEQFVHGIDGTYYSRAMSLLPTLENIKEFKGSFADQVAVSIKRRKNCSYKQLSVIEKAFEELVTKQNNNVATNTNVTASVTTANTANVDVNTVKDEPKEEDVTPREVQSTVNKKDISNSNIEEASEEKVKYDMTDSNCFNYTVVDGNKIYIKSLKTGVVIEDMVIPETVVIDGNVRIIQGIGIEAFRHNKSIKTLKTSKNITDIGTAAFADCTNLISVDLSESNHKFIASRLFNRCSNLENIILGNNVERIHEHAFELCSHLNNLTIPAKTDTIARSAFENCYKLHNITGSATFINERAFCGCIALNEFDFSETQTIGAHAFRDTALSKLTIPGNIRSVGSKCFADCIELTEVTICEGVEQIGDYCFAKSMRSGTLSLTKMKNAAARYKNLETVDTPKSLINIGKDAFMNVGNILVFVGSVSESYCIGLGLNCTAKDAVNRDNSSTVRFRSRLLDVNNTAEMLWQLLNSQSDGESNPEYIMREKGVKGELVNLELSQAQLKFMGIPCTNTQCEPHIKFKAACNYLIDVAPLFKLPLSPGVLRFEKALMSESTEIYNDGCNMIYKVELIMVDSLESGQFIVIVQNNHLRYCVETIAATDITMTDKYNCDDVLPLERFLHAGDRIGHIATVSGKDCQFKDANTGRTIHCGDLLLEKIKDNSFAIKTSASTELRYVPMCNMTLMLADNRRYDKNKEIMRDSIDCINVTGITDYQDLVNNMKDFNKSKKDNKKLFEDLNSFDSYEANTMLSDIERMSEEKQAHLCIIGRELIKLADAKGIAHSNITPEVFTYSLFAELARSYWLISKDEKWIDTTGSKSLNKVNEYKIGSYNLIESKSNQVVKFSNPYMKGQKGAYVYRLLSGKSTIGVYASRYSMQTIVNKLIALTDLDDVLAKYNGVYPLLMQDANNIDKINPELFADFYDVLHMSSDYNIYKYCKRYAFEQEYTKFTISMYKPTGIFYLVMHKLTRDKEKETQAKENNKQYIPLRRSSMPIFPIGNMDRALIVANTTNTNSGTSSKYNERMFNELLALYFTENTKEYPNLYVNVSAMFKDVDLNGYYKVRQMLMDGVSDVASYKGLVSDRAIYMMGIVHKGNLQQENMDDITSEDEEMFSEEFLKAEGITNDIGSINTNIIDEDYDTDYDEEYDFFVDEEEA